MNDTITTTELIALVLRGGKKILVTALVFALLLGGMQAFLQLRLPADSINTDQEQYLQSLHELEKTIAREEENLFNKQEYIDNSLYMQLDPYNVYLTNISLSVTDLDESAFQQVFQDEDTPVEYVTNKIVSHYVNLWNSFDLSEALGLSDYQDIESKYLREVVYVYSAGGGLMTIHAMADDPQESEALADAAYDLLVKQYDTVCDSAYDHNLSLFTYVTQNIIDTNMEATQQACYDDMDKSENTRIDAIIKLQNLTAPDSAASAIVKFAIVGAVFGAVAACLWLCLCGILRNRLLSSHQLERTCGIIFLGSVAKNRGPFTRLANAVAGERTWKDQQQAVDYIAKKAGAFSEGEVLLTSTLPLSADSEAVRALMKALGGQIRFETDFAHNPAALEALRACGKVVLLESVGHSDLAAVAEILSMAEHSGRSVGGFVLV